MKKSIFTGLLFLSTLLILAFSFKKADENEIKISVTADKPTKFNLHMFSEGETLKELVTPYEITVKRTEAKYIIKSNEANAKLFMKVEKGGKQRLTANWSLIVLLIENEKLSTFGFNEE